MIFDKIHFTCYTQPAAAYFCGSHIHHTPQVDMGRCPMSGVLPSPFISCCLWWHDLYIVLSPPPLPPPPSSPTLELVFKPRFNLHASCLQEEEVEEFRVSLFWFTSLILVSSRNQQKFDPPRIPHRHKLCMRPLLPFLSCRSVCVFVWPCLYVNNLSICSASSCDPY